MKAVSGTPGNAGTTNFWHTRSCSPHARSSGEIGGLVAQYKKIQRDHTGYRAFSEEVREELGDLFWYVTALARRRNLSLEEILSDNMCKTRERFLRPSTPPPHPLFDDHAVPCQQLPRSLEITFAESLIEGKGKESVQTVRIYRGGEAVVDPLDDNSDDNDNYRYHGVFHLAHMAVLGWSPVMRSLLRTKRSTDRDIGRIQDGGRAIAVEEGLSVYAFSMARAHSFFSTAATVPALEAPITEGRGAPIPFWSGDSFGGRVT